MTVIAIEEHSNLPELASAVRALPDDRGDESIALDELGDNLLFSTDYPFQRPSKADIERFGTAFPADEDREKFMAGNARSLFAIRN